MTLERDIIAVPDNKTLPFSTVVGYGELVFVSGLVGRDPESGTISAGDVGEQTRQTIVNIKHQLAAAGLSLRHVLKATVFLTDMRRVQEMNRAYVSAFDNGLPARSCVQVVALPDPEALVEIEVIAHR
jgi:2-iminobutanoate/2-iminopropanoate deaminase